MLKLLTITTSGYACLVKHVSIFLQDITQPPGKGEETKYHPTVPPAINFNALNDAESIHKTQSEMKFFLRSMLGFGKHDKLPIDFKRLLQQ